MESPELFFAEDVLQRTHLHRVRDLFKGGVDGVPDPLGGRVGCHPVGVLRFGGFQLLHQAVIFKIGDFRRVKGIVKLAVMVQAFHQLTVFVLLHGVASCKFISDNTFLLYHNLPRFTSPFGKKTGKCGNPEWQNI